MKVFNINAIIIPIIKEIKLKKIKHSKEEIH